MAKTIRYRPIIVGEPPDDGQVWLFVEGPNVVNFQGPSNPWPLDPGIRLEDVTAHDLPEWYARAVPFARVFPIREATAETGGDAYGRMLEAIEGLHDTWRQEVGEPELAAVA